MRSRYPALAPDRTAHGLTFTGALRAWGDGTPYEVEVTVPDWGGPDVRVLSPSVQPGAPHTYDDDGLLCLYHPDRRPWKPTDLAALTVVPWAALWLYFYEAWLETGVWWGPEAPH
jgi:hypothetical protein